MNFTTIIDNIHSVEWELSLSEAYIFSWIKDLSGWAQRVSYEGKDYYFGSRTKCIAEMPLLTDKPDTIYRIYRDLQSKGLVLYQKIGKCDYLHITEKGKQWNKSTMSEINPSGGKESEKNSEINPKNDSEINPTYKDTINTNDNAYQNIKHPLPPKGEETLADDKETELQPNISTSNEVPIINNPRQATRDKGGKFSEEQLSEMQAQFSEFRDYAKKIGMTAKSLEKEFANFIKKHHKKAQEILPILIPCLEAYYQDKTKCGTKPIDKQYIPHMQTYINGSHWEHYAEKITKQEPYEKIPNVFTIPRAIVSEIFRSKVNAKEWDETFALAQWNLYMKKSETLKNQAHDKQ